MSNNFSKLSMARLAGLSVAALLALSACGSKEAPATDSASQSVESSSNEVASTNTIATPVPEAAVVSEEDTKALAALPAPYNSADLANGKRQFGICQTCHNIKAGAGTKVGPDLNGVLTRKSGSVVGFAYSDGMKTAAIKWDVKKLDEYLKAPAKMVPGTKMAFAGIPVDKNRADVVAYVAVESAK